MSIADAVPTVTVLTGAVLALAGHTKMPVLATVTAIRRRVGVTTNVNVVAAAAPEYVAEKEPEVTAEPIALNVPVLETATVSGVTEPSELLNVTGTETAEPETSVSPVASVPSAALVASTATAIAAERSVTVRPSGAVTMTTNFTEPEAGAVAPSVYVPTAAECDAESYAYVGVVPYAAKDTESTHVTADAWISVPFAVVS